MTDYVTVRNWLYRGSVGITGDSSGFCFTQASSYNIRICNNSNETQPGTWFPTWAQVYSESAAIGVITGGSCSNTLGGSSAGTPANAATGYWGNYLPAIAYATSHGATGAAAAWARLIGATNWSALEFCTGAGTESFDNIPNWGVVPYSAAAPPPPPPLPPAAPKNFRRVG